MIVIIVLFVVMLFVSLILYSYNISILNENYKQRLHDVRNDLINKNYKHALKLADMSYEYKHRYGNIYDLTEEEYSSYTFILGKEELLFNAEGLHFDSPRLIRNGKILLLLTKEQWEKYKDEV